MNSTLRRTSVYTLRVTHPPEGADTALEQLAAAVLTAEVKATVTDRHTDSGSGYVSVSFRIETSDSDAVHVASHALVDAGLHAAEADLHTGLGVHNRPVPGLG